MAILLLSVMFVTADADIEANPNIASASIFLSTSMNATFTLSATLFCNISVKNVKLEEKQSNGSFLFICNLSSPTGATNAISLNSSKSYASSCTVGKTYRIIATFDASGQTVDRTSNEAKYN
jgi:hypothetical protein